jgi:uncharacterized heparinase superfamily protein
MLDGTWRFLGEARSRGSIRDWSVRHGSPLWSFHLQYHEGFCALAWRAERTGDAAAVAAIAEIADAWMTSTRAGGGDAWHPYTIAARTPHWLEALLLVGDRLDVSVRDRMVASLASQLDVLARRLERQVQANHLQRNYTALALGGLALQGPAAHAWRTTGLAGTWRALETDVLPDGMHVERSPMYHAAMLGDVLRVMAWCDAVGTPVPPAARHTVHRMVAALGYVVRPNDQLHQFHDAAQGIAPPASWLRARASSIADVPPVALQGAWTLPQGGYAGWADDAAGERLVLDIGAPGPRHQPGHAHCSALSFELDVRHAPLVVDPGVHGYDGDRFRAHCRSTAAHGTVQVGPLEQHEMWATFRVARFGRVNADVRTGAGFAATGEVHGYAGGQHRRTIERQSEGAWRLTDIARADTGTMATARLQLASDVEARADGSTVQVRRADGLLARVVFSGASRVAVVVGGDPAPGRTAGWVFPTFGDARPAPCIAAEFPADGTPLVTEIAWAGAA